MRKTPSIEQGKWVLLPGTLCTPAVFDPVLSALGVPDENRHPIDMDAPDVEKYAPRLRAAVTGGKMVCAFSLGSMVAAHNLNALSAARAIVLLACNPLPDLPGNRANREAIRARVLQDGPRGWVEENWPAMSTSRGAEPRETVIRMAEETRALIPAQTELAASRPGAAMPLGETDLPLIFITGEADRLTPVEHIRPIVDSAPNAHLYILNGLGHFALLEDPGPVARAIREGLAATAGETT